MIEISVEPLIPNKWEVTRHHCQGWWNSVADMSLDVLYPAKHRNLTGYEVLHELKFATPANAKLLDYLLHHPKEFSKYLKVEEPLFFFGTIYKDETGRESVRCACVSEICGVVKIYWRWRWLTDLWRANNPVLVIRGL